MNPTTRSTAPGSRRRRFMTAGVVAAGLSLAGAGAAMAGDETPGAPEVSGSAEAALPTPVPAAEVPAPAEAPAPPAAPTPAEAAEAPAPPAAPAPAEVPAPAEAPAAESDESAYGGYTQERADAFWGAGYGWADVEALVELWQLDYAETKARAGQMILDGETVPVAPTGSDVYPELDPTHPDAILWAQYEAFWDAGYTGEDVDALSVLWNSEFAETKARAGQMILDGQALPIAPASTPAG